MIKVAVFLLLVLTACTGKSRLLPSAEQVKAVEVVCGLPSGSLKLLNNEVIVVANPELPYKSIGCAIAEMQKRGLAGRVGFISEPPPVSEAK